jgi:translation initiation factor 4A
MNSTGCTYISLSADDTLEGHDVIMEAPFTTGKTHALCISALQILDIDVKTCQALILTSSFYEAKKIRKFTADVAHSMRLDCPAAVGSRNVDEDISALRDGQQLVVGTPSRVLELIRLDAIKIDGARLLVLDEADEMVARDFTEDILAIHQRMPDSTQCVFLSATMPHYVQEVANKLLRNPLHINISKCARPLHNIKQFYIPVETSDQKLTILSHLTEIFGVTQAVVFCNTRRSLESLVAEFAARNITNSAMHYDLPAFERADLFKEFKSGATAILLATNMLARGIDAHFVELIVNYELPEKDEDYFHRTSSRERFATGCSTVNLVTAAEVGRVREIERFYNTEMEEMPVKKSHLSSNA